MAWIVLSNSALGLKGRCGVVLPKLESLGVLSLLLVVLVSLNQVSGIPPYPVNSPGPYAGVETATNTYGSTGEEPMYYETAGGGPPPYGFVNPGYQPAGGPAPGQYGYSPQGTIPTMQEGYAQPQKPMGEQGAEPIRVQVEHIVPQDEKSLAPIVKGQGLFLLGFVAFVVCLIAIYSDPAAKGKNLGEGVAMNVGSLFRFQDFARSSLVVFTILLSPVLLVVGIVRLAMTLPAWIKWAWHNDELTLAAVGMYILSIWLASMSAGGKGKPLSI